MSLTDKIAAAREFVARYRVADSHIQLGMSGGKDSTASYLLLMELGLDFTPTFADTDNEHPWTVEYAQTLHEKVDGPTVKTVRAKPYTPEQWQARREAMQKSWSEEHTIRAGKRRGEVMPPFDAETRIAMLEAMRPTGNLFLDMCLMHGMFPLRRSQFCTMELKLAPVREQVIEPMLETGDDVITCSGVRADESRKRAGYKAFTQSKLYDKYAPQEVWDWFPILDWTWEDVFAMHARHGIEPNPLYKQGMARVGCMPCINATKPEIRQIHIRFPEQLERIAEWERRMVAVSRWCQYIGETVGFLAGTTSTGGSTVAAKVEWACTGRGDAEKDLIASDMEAPSCSSRYGLCE